MAPTAGKSDPAMAPTPAAPNKRDEKRASDVARKKLEIVAALCKIGSGARRRSRRRVDRPAPAAARVSPTLDQLREEMELYRRRKVELQWREAFSRDAKMPREPRLKEPMHQVPRSTEDGLAAMMTQLTTSAGGVSSAPSPDQPGLGESSEKMEVSCISME